MRMCARRVPNVGSPNLRNSVDFFSDTRSDPDADAAVHPLRPADGSYSRPSRDEEYEPGAVSNRDRAEDQEGSPHTVQRRRFLADDGLDDQQPQSHSP